LDDIDQLKSLLNLCNESSSVDLDVYLETMDQLKRAVSQLDPNRESFNDLLSIMTKRRESMNVGMQGAGYESEA
jgi:hypothetical protein